MPFFRKRKENTPKADAPGGGTDLRSIESTLKNDLLGVDDFKRSKIGFLTGVSAATKAISSLGNSVTETSSRLRRLFSASVNSSDIVPDLPASALVEQGQKKFILAMKLHSVSQTHLDRIQRNTYRSGLFYIVCSAVSVSVSLASCFLWTPTGVVEAVSRLGPLPLLLALAFKSCYTNWFVRRRSLDGAICYVRSFDWLPKNP